MFCLLFSQVFDTNKKPVRFSESDGGSRMAALLGFQDRQEEQLTSKALKRRASLDKAYEIVDLPSQARTVGDVPKREEGHATMILQKKKKRKLSKRKKRLRANAQELEVRTGMACLTRKILCNSIHLSFLPTHYRNSCAKFKRYICPWF